MHTQNQKQQRILRRAREDYEASVARVVTGKPWDSLPRGDLGTREPCQAYWVAKATREEAHEEHDDVAQ